MAESHSRGNSEKGEKTDMAEAILAIVVLGMVGFMLKQAATIRDLRGQMAAQEDRVWAGRDINSTGQQDIARLTEEAKKAHFLKLVSPKGNETLCLGQNFVIRWEGSTDINAVNIFVRNGDAGPTYNIGSAPVSFNERGEQNGKGEYIWQVGRTEGTFGGTEGGNVLQEGYSYQTILNGQYPIRPGYNGSLVDFNKQTFQIISCEG